MSNKYAAEWDEKPAGYYADPETKSRHDRKVRENKRFNEQVDAELEKIGLNNLTDIPTDEQIETAEDRARRKF